MKKTIRKSKKQLNIDYAIMMEWRKCLRLTLLWIYENLEYTDEAFDEFIDCYSQYFDAVVTDEEATDELDKEFEEYTGLNLSFSNLEGNEIAKCIKQTQAISIRVGGVILKEVYNMEKQTLLDFVDGMWEYLAEYPRNSARLAEMEKKVGISTRLKKI